MDPLICSSLSLFRHSLAFLSLSAPVLLVFLSFLAGALPLRTLESAKKMRWAMEAEEMEVVLERIWDLHDKISDAIHAISRAHFLKSIRTLAKSSQDKVYPEAEVARGGGEGGGGDGERGGCFVFVKGFRAENDEAAIAEAKGLNAIRTALENLEDRLEYFHTVQSQQQAERDAALARLEQSRIMLAMRLADYHGRAIKRILPGWIVLRVIR
ncbi:plastid division protein PDV1-like isoform X2 [Phoenix dactylifera]|uniref:Plastid division protein PDV1-like isoform X2 n=1 Tax=Phoenix dactylifera TaxID=42345 RepID=A0A8B7MVY9_PHODC|nr:plastid division protein PDV1-like isoform X2 [Phoenix dactylifera]